MWSERSARDGLAYLCLEFSENGVIFLFFIDILFHLCFRKIKLIFFTNQKKFLLRWVLSSLRKAYPLLAPEIRNYANATIIRECN